MENNTKPRLLSLPGAKLTPDPYHGKRGELSSILTRLFSFHFQGKSWDRVRTQPTQLTLGILPEASSQMLEAAVPAVQLAVLSQLKARSSKLESAIPAVHLISYISYLISSLAVHSSFTTHNS